ncbi:MAG: hypothetical protein HYU64_06475 [Armatimonadetes bacterium]|nr:hypothetical protein [Armatimonadota bacterium]
MMRKHNSILAIVIVVAYFFLAFAGVFHHHSGALQAQHSHPDSSCGPNETHHFLGLVLKSPARSHPGSPCVICQSLKDNGSLMPVTRQWDAALLPAALARLPLAHIQPFQFYDFGSPRAPPLS